MEKRRVYRFDHVVVDLETMRLLRGSDEVELEPKSFYLLEFLINNRGRVVPKEEIFRVIWRDAAVSDNALTRAIVLIRKALDDDPRKPRFIETVPTVGYRFIAEMLTLENEGVAGQNATPVQSVPSLANGPVLAASLPHSGAVVASSTGRLSAFLRPAFPALLGGLLMAAVVTLAFLGRVRARPITDGSSRLQAVPLTALAGNEAMAALSPDGTQVAFSWDQGRSDGLSNLFAKVVGAEHLLQLTDRPAEFVIPAWSPDGRSIAFLRKGGRADRDTGLFLVSAGGGPERRLADGHFDSGPYSEVGWSPDSQRVFFGDRDQIKSAEISTGEVRLLKQINRCDGVLPAVSPDGRWVAFTCYENGIVSIRLMTAAGDNERELISLRDSAPTLTWTSDSDRLVFTFEGKVVSLPREGGALRTFDFTHDADHANISRRGNRLAYTQATLNENLWRTGLRERKDKTNATLLEGTSGVEREADISPDGRRLAFASTRSGSDQVWVADLDGNNAIQLTEAHSLTGSPRWSPDGKWIIFDSRDCGRPCLYVVDPERRVPQKLSTGEMEASIPTWSRDGRWIYFTGQIGADVALYKLPSGGGSPILVSQSPVSNAQESRDGAMLYFASMSITGSELRVLDTTTGKEQALRGMPPVRTPVDWCLGSKGIYFVEQSSASLGFFDLNSRRVERTIHFPRPESFWGGLSLSPDETWIVYSQLDHRESDLMLIDGFR